MKRIAIGVMTLAIAALAGPAALTPSAVAATSGDSSNSEFIYCKGKYALCDRALCKPILGSNARDATKFDVVVCACPVKVGWSVAPKSCDKREPVTHDGLTFLISAYSNNLNPNHSTLTCNDPATTWADCYGAYCVVDPRDPDRASCTCPLKKGAMATLGDDCQQKSCGLIWSAADIQLDKTADAQFYAYVKKNDPGYPVNPPAAACPMQQ
jgi:hypothetical protein